MVYAGILDIVLDTDSHKKSVNVLYFSNPVNSGVCFVPHLIDSRLVQITEMFHIPDNCEVIILWGDRKADELK